MGIWVVVSRLTKSNVPTGWASTNAIFLFVAGVQLIILGIIGEYLAGVYQEVRSRPLYLIRSRTGFSEAADGGDKISHVRPARADKI